MDKRTKTTLIIIGIILLLIILYPKEAGYGYGGETTGEGQILTRQEYSCLGISYYNPSGRMGVLGLTRCVDCSQTKYCIGIPHTPKCYVWMTDTPRETERTIPCRE